MAVCHSEMDRTVETDENVVALLFLRRITDIMGNGSCGHDRSLMLLLHCMHWLIGWFEYVAVGLLVSLE